MTVSVSTQAFTFLCSIAGGIAIALLYDLFRIKRKAIKTGTFVTYAEDILYWLFVAIIMFTVVYYSNEGELRSYLFIGTALGVIFYVLLLSKPVINSSMFIIDIVRKVVRAVYFVVSYPFRLIFRLLAVPVRFAGKSMKSLRKAGRNRLAGASIWAKAFKNMRKKI